MSSITPTTSLTPTGTSTPATSGSNSVLNKDAFLQLMMAELKNQNPMSASNSDPMQFVNELAQFTSLEQQTNTAQATAQAATQQQNASALALLGHTVTYTDPTGATVTGAVQKVDFSTAGPSLTVNGNGGIDPASVSEVS